MTSSEGRGARSVLIVVCGLCLLGTLPAAARQARGAGTAETFTATARAENAAGVTVSAPVVVHLDRYTPDFDRNAVQEGLRLGGYPGFISALRKAPDVGFVQVGARKATIRWARDTPSDTGRTIVVVTDKPIAFIPSKPDDAKSRAGYLVALVRLTIDAHGTGTGTLVTAARIKAGGDTGVQVDDYADTPVVLTAVTRK